MLRGFTSSDGDHEFGHRVDRRLLEPANATRPIFIVASPQSSICRCVKRGSRRQGRQPVVRRRGRRSWYRGNSEMIRAPVAIVVRELQLILDANEICTVVWHGDGRQRRIVELRRRRRDGREHRRRGLIDELEL